jgi:hypothetical protein
MTTEQQNLVIEHLMHLLMARRRGRVNINILTKLHKDGKEREHEIRSYIGRSM